MRGCARRTPADPAEWRADVMLRGDDGARARPHRRRAAAARCPRESLRRAVGVAAGHGLGYQVVWEPAPLPRRAAAGAAGGIDRRGAHPVHDAGPHPRHGGLRRPAARARSPERRARGGGPARARLRRHVGPVVQRPDRGRAPRCRAARTAGCSRGCCRCSPRTASCGRRTPASSVVAPLGTPRADGPLRALLARFGDGRRRTVDAAPLRRGAGAGAARRRRIRCSCSSLADRSRRRAQLYVESPYARTYNGALGAAVTAAIARAARRRAPARARDRRRHRRHDQRTSCRCCLADRVEYTFTDLSPLFLERAAEQFAAYPFMRARAARHRARPGARRASLAAQYDMVIAANVLHATADLRQALAHARGLLAPRGLLLLLEGVAPRALGRPHLRPDRGLVAVHRHHAAARLPADRSRRRGRAPRPSSASPTSPCVPEDGEGGRGLDQQALIVARAPRPARRWNLVGDVPGVVAELAGHLQAGGDAVIRGRRATMPARRCRADEWVYLGALDVAAEAMDDGDSVDSARGTELVVSEPSRRLAGLTRAPWLAAPGWSREGPRRCSANRRPSADGRRRCGVSAVCSRSNSRGAGAA